MQDQYNKIKPIIIDLQSKPITNILKKYGTVYLVGGAIRSALNDETPNDIDLFLSADSEIIIDLIGELKSNKFHVRHELKRDYEGWSTKDLIMIHPTHIETFETYDIVIGRYPGKNNIDFDVNSLFIKIGSYKTVDNYDKILHIKNDIVTSISDDDLQLIIDHIKAKELSFLCTIQSLRENFNNVYGPGQLMKRLMKRINYGWTIVNTPENIAIAIYLLNVVHFGMYKQNMYKREYDLTVANIMKFLMNCRYDLKSFVRERESDFKLPQYDPNYKLAYFTRILNRVANKRTKMFDTELCKKIMTYCDIVYEKWVVNEEEYPGIWQTRTLKSSIKSNKDSDE